MTMASLMGRTGLGAGVATMAMVWMPHAGASQSWCEQDSRGEEGNHFCEVREMTLSADDVLRVDGGQNGGVKVIGWEENEVLVRARVWAKARSDGDAEALADAVEVTDAGGRIRAEGPRTGRRESWGVSFEIYTPHDSDLELEANNGGISISDVRGQIEFRTQNGGVHLEGVGGDVRGRTQNGGLKVELEGDSWDGAALDVETQNGGVTIDVPQGYSAEFETGTVNGGIDLAFPITVSGRLRSNIRTTLGDGGPLVRVKTTNGGVKVRQRGSVVR